MDILSKHLYFSFNPFIREEIKAFSDLKITEEDRLLLRKESHKFRILGTEDHPISHKVLRDMLGKTFGYAVEMAYRGDDAVSKFKF